MNLLHFRVTQSNLLEQPHTFATFPWDIASQHWTLLEGWFPGSSQHVAGPLGVFQKSHRTCFAWSGRKANSPTGLSPGYRGVDEDSGAGALEEFLDSSSMVGGCIIVLEHPVVPLPAHRMSSADRIPQSAHHTQVVSCCHTLSPGYKFLEHNTSRIPKDDDHDFEGVALHPSLWRTPFPRWEPCHGRCPWSWIIVNAPQFVPCDDPVEEVGLSWGAEQCPSSLQSPVFLVGIQEVWHPATRSLLQLHGLAQRLVDCGHWQLHLESDEADGGIWLSSHNGSDLRNFHHSEFGWLTSPPGITHIAPNSKFADPAVDGTQWVREYAMHI